MSYSLSSFLINESPRNVQIFLAKGMNVFSFLPVLEYKFTGIFAGGSFCERRTFGFTFIARILCDSYNCSTL